MLKLTATASVPRMSSDRSAIREIQRLDLQIGELRAEIERLPKYVAQIENKLAAHKQELADEKRVSFAWVVRDAVERYLNSTGSLAQPNDRPRK